ncbi:type IV pilus secretin PilQ [Sulfurirhabdus autotrophica]|uniref:Type IV pilus biogenesis and competence protein PilQ n=1 Tax=Sulfurirhabdus autotrophica TaxID=1706046 RepID=A0A4R3XTK0_9PROT|nr:type IV pilus secretin PilQ [Sulfurirhabdus autotrophica]TCV82202.1 type IV pilus assembly protein PilQ [Sulfurirhabdus autotrophica]
MKVTTPAKLIGITLPFIMTLGLAAMTPVSVYAAESAGVEQSIENSIQNIDYSVQAGGKIVLKISLKNPIQSIPAGFAINNPPRIALDFINTTNSVGKNTVNVDEGVLRNLNIVQAGKRTRLVMNLAKPASYDTRIDNGALLVTLQGSEVASATSNITTQFAQGKAGPQKHSIRDIDFRRGKAGEGRVVVDLSDTTTGIDIHKQGKTLVVDLVSTSLPTNLERRLDVIDFGTPVQSVDAFNRGENVRIVIEPKGQWEHSAYQADRQFIIEVKPVVEDPTKLAQGSKSKYSGEKLSLNFQNVEIRSVLQVIADFTGLNIITSDTVSGNLTLRLKDVPWDQALDIILQSKGLSMRKNGNVILIAPSEELATKEKLDLEARQQISELEATQTESYQLKYQKGAAMKALLSDEKQKLLSKRGSVVVDERTNTLFIQDTASKLDEIRKLINQIDVPVRQVMIESRIVEATDSFTKELGARLGVQNKGSINTTSTGFSGNLSNSASLAAGAVASGGGNLNVSLPVTGAAGSFALTLLDRGASSIINLEISALQSDGRGKIISSPRVITADQTEATIESGTEIPYQQASSSGATTVAFKKAVLSLKVKPQITPDDNVLMELQVNKDTPDYDHITAGVPPLLTKQINTQVLVENGGTVVIGGIYTQNQTESLTKVPLLGDIPVLGYLFKTKRNQDDKAELLIFITPKILKDTLNIR